MTQKEIICLWTIMFNFCTVYWNFPHYHLKSVFSKGFLNSFGKELIEITKNAFYGVRINKNIDFFYLACLN